MKFMRQEVDGPREPLLLVVTTRVMIVGVAREAVCVCVLSP